MTSSRRPASTHDTATWFEQAGFAIRFGWGPNDLRRLAPAADVVVIVDVLSFSTAVDVALGRGAVVLPYARHDGTEHDFAEANDAVVTLERASLDGSASADRSPTTDRADSAGDGSGTPPAAASGWSLSPSSLIAIPTGTRLVMPSPTGSALAFGALDAGAGRVHVACLRNARATAAACASAAVVTVIAAGERWRGATGPLRPALEDLLGAGAVIDALRRHTDRGGGDSNPAASNPGARADGRWADGDAADDLANQREGRTPGGPSPEAAAAAAVFRDARPELAERVASCGSGRELIDRGFADDVALAAELDVSGTVPTLDGLELRPH